MLESLSKEDTMRLTGFLSHVEEMKSTDFIQDLIKDGKTKTTISYTLENGVEIKTTAPNREKLSGYLTYFRQIYNNDDEFFINRVTNLILRYKLVDEPYLTNIKTQKKKFNKLLKQEPSIKIVFDGEDLTKNIYSVLDLFINGLIFHSDLKYYTILDEAKRHQHYAFLWQIFINSLITLSNYVFIISNNMKYIDWDKIKK